MIGAAIGAGLQAVGAIAGGIMRNKAMKKVKADLDNQEASNKQWYDTKYNEDALARADAQRLVNQTEEAIKRRNQQAAGVSAVMGGAQDALLATQEANAKAVSDTASAIAANAEARKDAIEQQFLAKQDMIDQQQLNLQQQKVNNIAQATQGVLGAGASIAGLDFGEKKKDITG